MITRTLTAAALLCAASPLLAQGAGAELPDPNDRSNSFTIAAGVASVPDYEGADEQRLTPAIAVRGRVAGMDFWSSATWLYLDVIAPSSSGMDLRVSSKVDQMACWTPAAAAARARLPPCAVSFSPLKCSQKFVRQYAP